MSELLLMSGGMDSAAIAAWRCPALCLTVNYGQRSAEAEKIASAQICRDLGLTHESIDIPCGSLGSGDMSDTPALDIAPCPEWWPFRNQLLLTVGGGVAVTRNIDTLLFGTVSTDDAHADGRADFFYNMNRLLGAQEGSLRVVTPAIDLTTAELVRTSGISREVLAWAHSCHTGRYACGTCRGCEKYLSVLRELGWR